ncbi:MAG: hypothetical protein IJZ20_07915, partial [Clostridia bacterium]|nr:hypothetical protein [Clostridia bacterium]
PYYAEYEKVESKLICSMTEEQRKLSRDYLNVQSQIEADLSVNNFIHGFKCGVKIIAEVFLADN